MQSIDLKKIGNEIKVRRVKQGIQQTALAEMLDITQTHLSNIENGAKPCSIDLLIRLSEIYGVSLDYLVLGRDVDGRATKERLRALIEALSALMESLDAGEVSN